MLFVSLCQFYLISKTNSQYYFTNLNTCGKKLARDHFFQQQDFFYLQTSKKLQLIDRAACRKLLFKLSARNKPFHSSSFRYRLTYIDRYVINSGCVMRTGYFYPNQSRRLKM